MRVDEKGRLIEQDIKYKVKSDYEADIGRASSGRSFVPSIKITPEGSIQQEETVQAYQGYVSIDGPAFKLSDELAAQQIELKDDPSAYADLIKDKVTEKITDKKQNISNKLVLIGAGFLLLLIVTRR